jgi:sterol desaturase/sphingolipid hydroxylase (fatty acid hydroxylase superfamily)
MGAMNFFRALASAFVVALMGAIMLGHLGTAPQRGLASTFVTTAGDVTMDHYARTFSHIFAVAVLFLIIGIISLIMMEERPLRTTVLATPVPETPGSAGGVASRAASP